jgi:hypothetical protein
VFVARSPLPKNRYLNPRLERLRALGLADQDIDLVFRERLVTVLAGPKFASVRADVLALSASPSPFVAIANARELYGDGTAKAFAPTKSEYVSGAVWQNVAASGIRACLATDRWAYIEGQGAAGKTVLCTTLALEWATARRPAYYLDLNGVVDADPGQTIEAMVRYGGDGVLFVVDNVHTAELHAGRAFDSWSARQDGSTLLLCGRRVSVDPWLGTGDRLLDIRGAALRVRATRQDVTGTYRRLAQRTDPEPPDPTRFLARRWTALFQGDLVAFAAALSAKHEAGGLVAELTPIDAVGFVRAQYLDRLGAGPEARAALTVIAALGVLEIAAPPAIAEALPLKPWLAEGAVLRVDGDLTLAHAGLARLLLAALGRPEIDVETLAQCATNDPAMTRRIVVRLSMQAGQDERRAFWDAALRVSDAASLLTDSVSDLRLVVKWMRSGAGKTWLEIDDELAQTIAWTGAAMGTPVRLLINVLRYCEERLPRCFERLRAELLPGDAPAEWLEIALGPADSPLRATFVEAAGHFFPDVVLGQSDAPVLAGEVASLAETSEADGLSRDEHRRLRSILEVGGPPAMDLDARLSAIGATRWSEIVVRSSPRAVRRLRGDELPATRVRIDEVLADAAIAGAWIDEMLELGTDHMARMMAKLSTELPTLWEKVGAELGADGDADAWAARGLSRGEAQIGTPEQVGRAFGEALELSSAIHSSGKAFIIRADIALAQHERLALLQQAVRVQTPVALGRMVHEAPNGWPRLNARLMAMASDAGVVNDLARELCNASLSDLPRVLVDHPLAAAVIQAVRVDLFVAGRAALEVASDPTEFPLVASRLTARGRRDLAEPLAPPLAQAIIARRVPLRRLHLAHASNLLRLLPTAGQQVRSELAAMLGDEAWLTGRVAALSAPTLAQALYSLWLFGPELVPALSAGPLQNCVADELANDNREGVVRLIGAVSLYDSGAVVVPEWVGELSFAEVVTRDAWDQRADLAPGLGQTLLGLQVLEASGVTMDLPHDVVDRLVARCVELPGAPARARQLVAGLRVWLEGMIEA